MSKIGIVLLATNSYFTLGVRFIKKFMHHYKGSSKITFYFFSDEDPASYLQDDINVEYRYNKHDTWMIATNSKFINMLSLADTDNDYLIYFDADTSVSRDFTEEWFIGETVGLEHFGNNGWMKDVKGYDRNPNSRAYVPHDTPLFQMYYHGCLFGGSKDEIIKACIILRQNQIEDKKIPYEPGVNDESYINQYYHYNPPTRTVLLHEYMFNVSDKGGIGETRNTKLDITALKEQMLANKDNVYDFTHGELRLLNDDKVLS
jgi:hypothetical protein